MTHRVNPYEEEDRDIYFKLRNDINELDCKIKSNATAISILFKTGDCAPWDPNGLVNFPESTWKEFKQLTEAIRSGMKEIQKKGDEMIKFRDVIRSHEKTLTDPHIRKLVVRFDEGFLSKTIGDETDDSVYGVRMPFHFAMICIVPFNLTEFFLAFSLDG